MGKNEQALKQEVSRYRAMRALGLMRSLAFALVGVIGLILTLNGSIFPPDDSGQPKGWLYDHLGKQGATVAAVALMGLIILIGVVWSYRIYRDMMTGYKKYEAQMRRDIDSGVKLS